VKDEKFTAYTERCLDLARNWGWEKEIKAKEKLAWELHEQFPPAGSLLLDPTGKEPLEWFRNAIDPQLAELADLCRCRDLGADELRMIVERAEAEGWKDSPLAALASSELEPEEESHEQDSETQ